MILSHIFLRFFDDFQKGGLFLIQVEILQTETYFDSGEFSIL